MKGNPVLRTVLVLLLLAAVAYPVSRVISHDQRSVTTPSPTTDSPVQPICLTGTLRIKAAPSPRHLEVTSEGKVVLETRGTNGSDIAKELSLPSGSDLLIRVEWADDHPHALRAEFLPTGTNTPVSHDYWSARTLEDVLSLP